MIIGIVLAAGRSLRMGRPKAFLEFAGGTFLSRSMSSLAAGGCEAVVVVTGSPDHPEHEAIARAAREAGASVAVNDDPESEQVDSLRAALRSVPTRTRAVVVSPVDVPGIRAETVRSMIRRFRETGASLVVPTHGGARGHPILIASRLFPGIGSGDLPEGVRSLIRRHEAELQEVDVDDPNISVDVDTPAEYRELLERRA